MVFGSPPCTAFIALQRINKNRRPAEIIAKEIAAGRQHLKFTMRLYEEQAKNGRYFLHEHPHTASSWATEEVMHMSTMPSVEVAVCHMCRFGMMSCDQEGPGLVKTPTRFMSNSPEVCKKLERRCTNIGKADKEKHRHVLLVEGRASACQEYPKALCQAVCEGVALQKKKDLLSIRSLNILDGEEVKEIARACCEHDVELSSFECPAELLHEPEGKADPGQIAEDDVSGEALDASLVRTARKEEIAYFRSMGVYKKVPIQKSYEVTGKGPIGVRWIDVNKGDRACPKYRSTCGQRIQRFIEA